MEQVAVVLVLLLAALFVGLVFRAARRPAGMIQATRPCPYCQSTVDAEAITCRFCGRNMRN